MAIVENEYTSWRGHTGLEADVGRLLVWADDTGQHRIDRVEIDNRSCTNIVPLIVKDDNGVVMLDQIVQPGALFTDTQAAGVSWRRNTQQRISQWDVILTSWNPDA